MSYFFDDTKSVETVQGLRARIICNNRQGDKPIVALVENCGKPEAMVIEYYEDGTHPFNPTLDLRNK